jgi:hypothetical protein
MSSASVTRASVIEVQYELSSEKNSRSLYLPEGVSNKESGELSKRITFPDEWPDNGMSDGIPTQIVKYFSSFLMFSENVSDLQWS